MNEKFSPACLPSDTPFKVPARQGTCFATLSILQMELRKQRKHLLGSHISLRSLVYDKGDVSDELVDKLCDVLSDNTLLFWKQTDETAREFCYRYYKIVVSSIAYGRIRGESIDDIIRLAECLVDSREIFEIVMKQLLPENKIGEMFSFVESYDDSMFAPAFAEAVLAAVSVFLGALEKPLQNNPLTEETL